MISYFILIYFILFYFILFYFILFYFILFYFILIYFILFYFISFHFIWILISVYFALLDLKHLERVHSITTSSQQCTDRCREAPAW